MNLTQMAILTLCESNLALSQHIYTPSEISNRSLSISQRRIWSLTVGGITGVCGEIKHILSGRSINSQHCFEM